MSTPQRILILTGVFLIAWTMAFGVLYAIFDEHQTLEAIGSSLASGFTEAARGDLDAAFLALDRFASVSAEYRYEVHSHGHWGMLALVLILLGLAFDKLHLRGWQGPVLAWVLALGATLFPLGVLLQSGPLAGPGKLLSVSGSIGLVVGLLAVAGALLRKT